MLCLEMIVAGENDHAFQRRVVEEGSDWASSQDGGWRRGPALTGWCSALAQEEVPLGALRTETSLALATGWGVLPRPRSKG